MIRVICRDEYVNSVKGGIMYRFTLNKEYYCEKTTNTNRILDDNYKLIACFKTLLYNRTFISVEEMREEKLNIILNE